MGRRRVLMIAPNFNREDVGEAWSSYQWVAGLAEHFDVTALTYTRRDRPAATPQIPGARVIEWRDLPLVGRGERFNAMLKPGYVAFHRRARGWIRRALASGERFDVALQVAPLAIRYPSPLVGMGIPYLIGPLAGSLPTPPAFRGEVAEPWYMRLRELDRWRLRSDPWLRRTYREAQIVIGVGPYVGELMDGIGVKRFEWASETGVETLPPPRPMETAASTHESIRLLYVGRVVRTKGLRDAVRALGHLPPGVRVRLDAVGDGPDLAACRREAAELGLGGCVVFHGRVPRERVDEFYRAADVFVFPSFREPSGNVVLEAMGHALPLIVADRGGPGYAVRPDAGVRVAVRDPAQFARDLAAAIEDLAQDRARLACFGQGARELVTRQHLWPKKIEWMCGLIEQVVGAGGSVARR